MNDDVSSMSSRCSCRHERAITRMFYTCVCPCTSKSLKSPILTRISPHSIYLGQFYIQYDDGDAEDLVDRRNIKGKESRKESSKEIK